MTPPWTPSVAQPLRCGRSVTRQAPRTNHLNAALPQICIAPRAVHRASGEDLMSNLINYVKSLAIQEDGQDLLEYALLVALIALVAIGAVTAAGGAVSTIFSSIAAAISV
jgi:pilus assembly protein Flp/PilA